MPDQLLLEFKRLFDIVVQLFDALKSTGNLLIILIPVGYIGIYRWGVWLLRKLIGLRYRPQEPSGYMTTTSVITPVYNENPEVFLMALRSWAANKPSEIIAVIDYTDEKCIQTFTEFEQEAATTGVVATKLIITKKPGKRPALVDGALAAIGEIVFLVDSDTIWSEDVLVKAIAPFEDPDVGGVTTRQNVLNPRTIAQRLFDVYLDIRYLDEIRFLAVLGNAVTCISGRTAVYRRAAILPVLDNLENETFWGRPVISGDDKTLTNLVQAQQWKVRYQENARVYTPGAPQLGFLIKQRIRWARNSWRSDLRTLFSTWLWREPALAFHLIDRLFQPVTTLIAPTYFFLSIYYQRYFITIILVLWWLVSRTIKLWGNIRRRRSSIIVLPWYILFSYWFAILRIYAFFTMNLQGWGTRWSSNRMRALKPLRLIPAYLATAITVALLVLGINLFFERQLPLPGITLDSHVKAAENELPNYNFAVANSKIIQVNDPPMTNAGATKVGEGLTSYEIGVGDTPQLIALKYGIEQNAITVPDGKWEIGQKIQIKLPFKDYETYRQAINSAAGRESNLKVQYKPEINAITVDGWGAVLDVPTLYARVGDNSLLEDQGNGVYLLKTNLILKRHTLLLVEAPQVSWFKLKSDATGTIRLFGDGGGLGISGVKISTWDPLLNDYDKNYEDGRSHIRINNARMDVVNSEISFLGQPATRESGGGVYGLAWRIETSNKFGKELVTGHFENNKVHDNYFGFYAFGATNMIIRNNEVFNNVQYGFDPHDDSNNFIVEDNYIHDNGNHGIIFSRRCFNNIIRRNRSINNRLHGVMLDRESDNNSIYDNILDGNTDGVIIWRSSNNLIYNNKLNNNKRGILMQRGSATNIIHDNQISGSKQYGVYIYEATLQNWNWKNTLDKNRIGVYIRSTENYIFHNQITDGERGIYLTTEAASNQIANNEVTGNKVGMYLKTGSNQFLANNFPNSRSNTENIRFTDEWAPVSAGPVNIFGTIDRVAPWLEALVHFAK
jgi:parallel beta-helix repeat protein